MADNVRPEGETLTPQPPLPQDEGEMENSPLDRLSARGEGETPFPDEEGYGDMSLQGEANEPAMELSADGELAAALTEDQLEAPSAAVADERQTRPGDSWWGWLRELFTNRMDDGTLTRRLAEFDQAIESAPDEPSNYILRGEVLLAARDYQRARDDFQRGLELAEGLFEGSAWGILAQTLRDRALVGLAKAEKKLSAVSDQLSAKE